LATISGHPEWVLFSILRAWQWFIKLSNSGSHLSSTALFSSMARTTSVLSGVRRRSNGAIALATSK
jgi:hypothetical protein